MAERWLPVIGYEGCYEVSDYGRVRSLGRRVNSPTGGRTLRARLLVPMLDTGGYPRVSLNLQGSVTIDRVHRLVLKAFVGPPPAGLWGCHYDGNPGNNRLSNLRWDSPSSNVADAKRHGTLPEHLHAQCRQGHDLAPPNLNGWHLRVRGHHVCQACTLTHSEQFRARKRGEPFDFEGRANARYAAIMRAVA